MPVQTLSDHPLIPALAASLEARLAGATGVVTLTLDARAPAAAAVQSRPGQANLTGRQFSDLSGAAYWFLERLGFLFEFSGETAPPVLGPFPTLDRSFPVRFRRRGIRMHLNFVQDQSFFSEPEFAAFVDRLPTLKFNSLLFHMYPNQEWFFASYRGVEQLELTLGNLERRALRPDMIGRDKIAVAEHWFPREFEAIRDPRALRDAVHARYRRMMARARGLGITVAASLEPESVAGSYAAHLAEWAAAPVSADQSLSGSWQSDWSGHALADGDVRHPVVKDLAVTRALALLDGYPELDELHLISREGAAYRVSAEASEAELDRLEARFALPAGTIDRAAIRVPVVVDDPTVAGNPRSNPYWTVTAGESRHATVLAVLRFAEMARDMLEDARLAGGLTARGVRPVVTIYAPDPGTVRLTMPAVARILPPGQAFHLLADYGARDITRNLDAWAPVIDGRAVGMVSWLEFDGCMMLAQDWHRSLAENVRQSGTRGMTEVYFNHWRVRGLESGARAAAETAWDPDTPGVEDPAVGYGVDAPAARHAYEALEDATVYAKDRAFNVGFTADWVIRICTEPPGYYWKFLLEAAALYDAAAVRFAVLAPRWERARYLADLCRISAGHLRAVNHLQLAKLPLVGFKLWPLPTTEPVCLPPPELLNACKEHARQGLVLEYDYLRTLAARVTTSDEQGQLAMHQQGLVEPWEELYAALERWSARELRRG